MDTLFTNERTIVTLQNAQKFTQNWNIENIKNCTVRVQSAGALPIDFSNQTQLLYGTSWQFYEMAHPRMGVNEETALSSRSIYATCEMRRMMTIMMMRLMFHWYKKGGGWLYHNHLTMDWWKHLFTYTYTSENLVLFASVMDGRHEYVFIYFFFRQIS